MHALKQTQLAAKALPHVARMLSSHLAASNGTYTLRLQGEDADLPLRRKALVLFAEFFAPWLLIKTCRWLRPTVC